MQQILLRTVNHFRPREGWILYFLCLTALLCMPAAILALNQDLATGGLLVLTVLAALVSLRLARSRLKARTAAIVSGLLGLGLVVLIVGRLLPPLPFLWGEVRNAVHWLNRLPQDSAARPVPFVSTAAYAWQRLTDLGVRLWWWGQKAAAGVNAQDSTVSALFASLSVWAAGCFATWQIYRRRSALVGLLPSGVILAAVSFFGGGLSLFYLFVYLFCTLSLVAAWHLRTLQERWQQTGTDYPGDLEVELGFSLALVLLVVLGLGAIFPVVGPRQVGDAFWRVMERPWSSLERASERLFGPVEVQGGGVAPGSAGTLPRAHLLGGAPELSQTIALYVTTNDPAPPSPPAEGREPDVQAGHSPRRYWRASTYDTYTGYGWVNGPLEQRIASPNQPLQSHPMPGGELIQHYQIVGSQPEAVYAVNPPASIDRTVRAWWRAPDDLAQMTGAARQYVAISTPPQPTVAQLRGTPPSIPAEVADRYLALPQTIPEEVLVLARQVVGSLPARYDQARAIETYLRAYPYTLDLPNPPTDRDLVDYFLFDLQKGYCDYYASAMVVMARAVGIPARLATGYAQGTYDQELGRWVVTEKDGHTWVEVFFEGIGWVEFEPTAGLPALDRPGGDETAAPAVPPIPPRSLRWWQRVPWVLVGLCLTLVLAIAFVAWLWHPARTGHLVAGDLVRDRYTRLLRWGTRLDEPLHDGQTASEYATSLARAVGARGQSSHVGPLRRSSQEAPAEVHQLADTFVRAQYAAQPLTDREGRHIRNLWPRLRRRLWWLWLSR